MQLGFGNVTAMPKVLLIIPAMSLVSMAERFREVVYYEHAEVCLLSAFEPVRVLLWAPCFETESEVLAGWTV